MIAVASREIASSVYTQPTDMRKKVSMVSFRERDGSLLRADLFSGTCSCSSIASVDFVQDFLMGIQDGLLPSGLQTTRKPGHD